MMQQGGCDTHVHIIGDPRAYPMVAERHYTPGYAGVPDLQAHLLRQGLTHAVIVQPSVYGTNNQCLLDALVAMQGHARGIAVLDIHTSDNVLHTLDAQGIRGIRLNLESSGEHNTPQLQQALEAWAPRLVSLGWHIQVYAPMAVTVACAPCIAKLPVPVVLDHFALWKDASCESLESKILLDLLVRGCLYIKLSASYRSPLKDVHALQALSKRLLNTRPDRLLWASDWPHTNREPGRGPHEVSCYREISPSQLQDERMQWLPSLEAQQLVGIDNPRRLYRF